MTHARSFCCHATFASNCDNIQRFNKIISSMPLEIEILYLILILKPLEISVIILIHIDFSLLQIILQFSKVPISFKDLHVKSNSNKIYLLNALREGEQSKKDKLLVNVPSKTSKKQQRLIKRIPKRKTVRRQYHDLIDRMIRKKNGPNMKVKWSSREDHCLMLCKAGDIFLNPSKLQKQQVYYNVFRDVLHRVCPQSKNKTSR